MKSFKHYINENIESTPIHYKTDKTFRQHWIDKGVDNSVTETSTCIRTI